MMTGVMVITVTTTRTHTPMMTPTGGLKVGMTTGLGRLNMLPLRIQYCLSLSQLHRPALLRAQLVSLMEELHLPRRALPLQMHQTFQPYRLL